MPNIAAQEYLALGSSELHWTQFLTHTILHNHTTNNAGSLLEVTVGTGSDFPDEQLL
ncbi:hypothetical protein D3C81_2004880 [compost metagenome]